MNVPATRSRSLIARRFRGFLPVAVDVETAGFDPERDALLEIAAVTLTIGEEGLWQRAETVACHVEPFMGANLDEACLKFNGIDPFHPFRCARPEPEAMERVLATVRAAVAAAGCNRAILVGHNPAFDLAFLKAAVARAKLKHNPFHSFSTFDTATLAGLAYGQTVLSRAVEAAGYGWDSHQAHSAIYDAERTAELFCAIVNRWNGLAGRPQRQPRSPAVRIAGADPDLPGAAGT
ncbi:MAG: ribonuclease T [Gammaproteobacteria bacterium]